MHVAYLDLNKGFNTISQSIFLEELMAAHDLDGCTVGDGRQMSTKNSRKKIWGVLFFSVLFWIALYILLVLEYLIIS